MKTFPILVEFPDNLKEEEVLYNIMSHLPLDSYEGIGVRFRTTNVITEKYNNYMKNIGLLSLTQPSKTKS